MPNCPEFLKKLMHKEKIKDNGFFFKILKKKSVFFFFSIENNNLINFSGNLHNRKVRKA